MLKRVTTTKQQQQLEDVEMTSSSYATRHLKMDGILVEVQERILWFLRNDPVTVPIRKTRFFPAHFMKLPVAPMISKIHKQYVPHLKDLKLSFKLRYQTFQKSSRLKFFRLNFKS